MANPRPDYVFSFDTETFLIRPGVQAPPIVCAQYKLSQSADRAQPTQLLHARDLKCKEAIVWALGNALCVGSRVAYDMACVASSWPELLGLVFQAYAEDRVTCIALRQMLADIARGIALKSQKYNLSSILEQHTGRKLDKLDPWRLMYGRLWFLDVEDWPGEAVAYALLDGNATHDGYWAQEAKYRGKGWLFDEYAQARADFWLYLTSAWGIHTDPVEVAAYHDRTLKASEIDRAIATQAGLVRADGSKDTKAAMRRMVEVMKALDEDLPLTDGGQEKLEELKKVNPQATGYDVWAMHGAGITLDEDACLASGDSLLEAYQRYGSLSLRLGRCERLYRGFELPLQAQFNALVETGRTSCKQGEVEEGVSPPAWGTQLQNMNTGMVFNQLTRKVEYQPGMRECFIPRAG